LDSTEREDYLKIFFIQEPVSVGFLMGWIQRLSGFLFPLAEVAVAVVIDAEADLS
jgi:hypothetical protein